MKKLPAADPPNSLDEYTTIDGMVDDHPDLFSKTQLRWALRYRSSNGLAEHTLKFGKRLYIHVPGFVTWLRHQDA